jgi:hypothetical protein
MQAGSGGRTKLSVGNFQFLVKDGKRFFCVGAAGFARDAKEVVSG